MVAITNTIETIERPDTIQTVEREREAAPDTETSDSDTPPIFGRCPVCDKPLRPRDRYTGEAKAPPVGAGILSRAKCDRCGAVIEYVGNGKWVVFWYMGEG